MKNVWFQTKILGGLLISLTLSGCLGEVELSDLSAARRQVISRAIETTLPSGAAVRIEVSPNQVGMYTNYVFQSSPNVTIARVLLTYLGQPEYTFRFGLQMTGVEKETGREFTEQGFADLISVSFNRDGQFKSAYFEINVNSKGAYTIYPNGLEIFAEGEVQFSHSDRRTRAVFRKMSAGPQATALLRAYLTSISAKLSTENFPQ